MNLTMGIDVGSSTVKCVITHSNAGRDGEVLATRADRIRRRDMDAVVEDSVTAALAEAKVTRRELDYIATTGEGDWIAYRTGHFYGMTTHARGALELDPEARGVLDVGGLHARAILMDERSKVLGYRMTSQCASGSGQFLENISRYLGCSLAEVGQLSLQSETPEQPSGICAVLAETDVINMVSRGIKTADILKGIHLSMANRYARLLRAAGISGVMLMTGGLALDVGLVGALREELERQKIAIELRTHPDSMFAGALGAALWGAFRSDKLTREGVA
jgi:benzoyl-CoA reductase subunit D